MFRSPTSSGWHELDPLAKPGPVLRALLILPAAAFVLQGPLHLEAWAVLRPEEVFLRGRLWQLLSYALLHQDLLHLLFNLLGIWTFGTELERLWGGRALAWFAALCAMGGGLAHAMLEPLVSGRDIGVVGASGVVYGLLAAYGLLFRQRRLLFLGLIPVQAGVLALVFGALALFSGAAQSQDGVAHFAHLGGMAMGLILLGWGPAMTALRRRRHRLRMGRHLARVRATGGLAAPRSDKLEPGRDEADVEARLDELLAKVSREGLAALTAGERAFLDEAARWLKARREARR
jgi:membrane associated rhomboid family serine protease